MTVPNVRTTVEERKASFSALFCAIRFGTSSPNTSEKYERITVTMMVQTVLKKEYFPLGSSQEESLPVNLFAAKALARNPASVTPT